MRDHDSNRHHQAIDTDYLDMSLAQLQITIDGELLNETVADIMSLPAGKRSAAIADFAEIDPILGAKLHLAVSFASA